jgi:DNA-binding GntR family transcriptional regulator
MAGGSTTLTLTVVEQIRRRILSGELLPGTRLRQIEWAEKLGVSPTPVREAFTALAKEGLIRHDAQRGVVVFTPTVEDVVENYDIRLALEPLATELAAKAITAEELAQVDGVIERMRSSEGEAYQRLNREFHYLIYRSARRPQLADLIESLRDRFEAYVALDTSAHPDPAYGENVQLQHEAIAAALRARAPKRARKLMEEHLKWNRLRIATSVEFVRGAQDQTAPTSA